MRLIRWSVDHPRTVLAVHAVLVLLSLVALGWFIPVRLTPVLPSPLLEVRTEAMGLPAELVESAVTTPLERELAQVTGVRGVRSVSMDGMSVITFELADVAAARADVAARVGAMSRVVPLDPLRLPVVRLAVRGVPRDFVETVVAPRLRRVPGVDTVGLYDGPLYRCNGRPAVEVNVYQAPSGSAPRVAEGVRRALAELGVEYEEAYDNAHFVGLLVADVWAEVGLAIVLTGLVVFGFLRDLRGTLIALATVPASLAVAVLAFGPLGLSFNSSSLVGLLLAIGRLVDDTIIDLHSVRSFRMAGYTSRAAAIEGCSAVRRPVIVTTVVLGLGVLPLMFAGGLTQAMFQGLVGPFILALLASLGVSLTLTPVLSAYAYRGVPGGAAREWGLPRLPAGMALAVAFSALYLTWMLWPLVGAEMMPLSDTGQLYVMLEARPGTPLEETDRLTAQLEEILRRQPEVSRVSSELGPSTGVAGYGVTTASMASLMVTLRDERERSIWQIADAVQAEGMRTIPQLRRLTLKEMGSDVMASSMAPVELVLHGNDQERLVSLAEGTRDLARGVAQASTSTGRAKDGLRLEVDGTAWGLTEEEVLAALAGRKGWSVSAQRTASPRPDGQGAPFELAARELVGPQGQRVPLDQVARWVPGRVYSMLEHDGLRRSVSVTGAYRPGGPPSMQLSMQVAMEARMQLPFPRGYDLEQRGDMTQMMDSFARLLKGLGVSLVLIYLVLALEFSSLVVPLVIMATIPLAWPGAVLALLLTGQSFSTVSLLGVIVLNGMDVTSSVLVADALRHGRPASSRLQPVLMTVLVTLAVMIPLAFFPRPGLDAYAPLATVIVGGLATSTLLSLGLVPALAGAIGPGLLPTPHSEDGSPPTAPPGCPG